MYWELWDIKSNNLVAEFDSEDEALQGVRDMLAVNRPGLIDEITLGAMYGEDEPQDAELPPVLAGDTLRARLTETAPDPGRAVHEKIRRWLAEERWQVDDLSVPPDSFNVVAIHHDGRAINIFQPMDVLDHVALSLRWSYDRVRQMIGGISDEKMEDLIWSIYRDASLMGVDIFDSRESKFDMILRTHVYFDGLTKDTLMQRIQLVNRAYALAMRASVRVLEAPGFQPGHALSPEEARRIMRPIAEAAGPLSAAS